MPREIRPLFFLLSLFSFATITSAQVPGFYMKGNTKKVEIPILVSNNLVIVQASINDSPPINFLLDTGVKTNILFSKTLGDMIGLNYTRKLDLVGADGSTVLTASVSPNNQMELGELDGVFQTILVLDEDFLELERVIGVPVFGVIGFEFFKYNPVKIDYDLQKITFYSSDRFKRRPWGFKRVPIKIENSKPYFYAQVNQDGKNSEELKLLIDTGANHGLMLNLETSDKIYLPENHIESDLGKSLGGELYGAVARTRSLKVSRLRFRDVITSFPDETEFSYVIKESGRQGSIGSEVLGRMNIIFDYTRDRMLVRRGETFAVPFEFDMSGITPRMYPSDEKMIYIGQVRKNSPGDLAGVKEGDEIVAINSLPIAFWELSDIFKLLRSSEGREINMVLKRYNSEDPGDFELNEVVFKLRRQI